MLDVLDHDVAKIYKSNRKRLMMSLQIPVATSLSVMSRLAVRHVHRNCAGISTTNRHDRKDLLVRFLAPATQATVTREAINLKQTYEHELTDAICEKAKLEIEKRRLWEESDDIKKRLVKENKELVTADNNARLYEQHYGESSGKYNTICSERKRTKDDMKELEKENEKLERKLSDLRKALEQETLVRIDLEDNIKSVREELTFKNHVYEQELTKTCTRRQLENSEIDSQLS